MTIKAKVKKVLKKNKPKKAVAPVKDITVDDEVLNVLRGSDMDFRPSRLTRSQQRIDQANR